MESAKPKPFLTVHSKTYTDYLVTDASDFAYVFVLHTAHKRHATDPVFRALPDGSRSQISLQEVTKSSGIREVWIGEPAEKPAKEAVHSVSGEKIVTEFVNNGKRTHSSEITVEVAKSLLKVTTKGEMKDQEAEDDNNFWKNPVNQTQQSAFAEDSKPSVVRYGGHISREEVLKAQPAREAQHHDGRVDRGGGESVRCDEVLPDPPRRQEDKPGLGQRRHGLVQ